MSDIINLLPESVANQIAAGEVIQRPASAVKELLENAIDAGATDIKLIVKDAGKSLIQVIDNGSGMSPTDARMSFERHATSKITKASDLFAIQTMGFRGEALASIAAIAHVEVRTKKQDDEIGTQIEIEGSQIKNQTEIVCKTGTIFSIKNLYFNTPARRNFLKSNMAEMRHIQDVFVRIALVNPQLRFAFYDEQRQKFDLRISGWKQRIIELFGKGLNQKLLNVNEITDVVEINGFVGKPETARKTRGEQYFFVNKRYIKHPYLNHAVQSAFEELIPSGAFASYFINFTIDPEKVDVNIHPTKTEVNFQDEKTIYSLLRSAIKMTLGKFAFSPILDFETEMSFNHAPLPPGAEVKQPESHMNPDYNPFSNPTSKPASDNYGSTWQPPKLDERQSSNHENWQQLYKNDEQILSSGINAQQGDDESIERKEDSSEFIFFQIANKYIAMPHNDGLWLINQQHAHERVLFDRYSKIMSSSKPVSQGKMFAEVIQFSANDLDIINELWQEIQQLGFQLNKKDNGDIEVTGAPPEFNDESVQEIFEGMLEHYKNNQLNLQLDKHQNMLLSMAKNLSITGDQKLSDEEISALMEAFMNSDQQDVSPSGNRIMSYLSAEELADRF
ncbi:MAG: DNA mismatch repair endonuclease MutL [Bacteroidales bacterium]|nr:DNA mismatch repair endonuclease MutL [Bacteroidales bacterium]